MKQHITGLMVMLSACLGLLGEVAVGSAEDPLGVSQNVDRATQVTFNTTLEQYIEGNAPVVRLALNGPLVDDMYMQVLVWDQRKSPARLIFKQTLKGEPSPNGTYMISRRQLNDLEPGKYLMQVALYQAGSTGLRLVDLVKQPFKVLRTPPPVMEDPAPPTTAEPDPTPPSETPTDAAPDSPETPTDATPDSPEAPTDAVPDSPEAPTDAAPDSPDATDDTDVPIVIDEPLAPDVTDVPTVPDVPTAPDVPADPPPTNVAKQVVWDLTPQDGKTYSNLILRGGVRAVWQSVNNVTFIDCDFRDAAVLLTVQARDDGSDASRNWRFVRCTFKGATRDDWGHSHGAFLQGVDNFVFSNCVFSDNGWLGNARFNQNHNVYLLDVGAVTFSNCTFDRAAAQGIKGLGYRRLEVDNCTFSGNLIDIGSDDRSASGALIVRNCRFYNTGGVDSIGLTIGWSLALEHYNNDLISVLIEDCKWSGPAVSSNTWAVKLAGGGVKSAQIIDCDFSQWKINTDVWPKIVNQIGGRLLIKNSTGID